MYVGYMYVVEGMIFLCAREYMGYSALKLLNLIS